MTTIIGVDFSGARTDRNTWITRGHLAGNDSLLLTSAQRIRRSVLYDLLLVIPTPAVAALDFPFGVPAQFAKFVASRSSPSSSLRAVRLAQCPRCGTPSRT